MVRFLGQIVGKNNAKTAFVERETYKKNYEILRQ